MWTAPKRPQGLTSYRGLSRFRSTFHCARPLDCRSSSARRFVSWTPDERDAAETLCQPLTP
jgi:hypothetical protein